MPRPSRADVLTAFRQDALLEAARKIFGRDGFERATMDAIAKVADVAKGTIYLYYPSKKSIYWAALSDGIAELDALTRTRVEAARSLREAIATFIATKVEYCDKHRDFFRIYASETSTQLAGPPYGHPDFKPVHRRQIRILQDALNAAIARREIRNIDPAQIARAIFDLTRGLVLRRVLAGRRAGVEEEVAAMVDLIWHGLAPKGTSETCGR